MQLPTGQFNEVVITLSKTAGLVLVEVADEDADEVPEVIIKDVGFEVIELAGKDDEDPRNGKAVVQNYFGKRLEMYLLVCWQLIAPPSTPDFQYGVGLNPP